MFKNQKGKRLYFIIAGLICGFLNGFFGAGGGSVAVPLLKKAGIDEKKAHATSVAVILAVTLVSAGFYLYRGDVTFSDSLSYSITGVFGAVLGSFLLKKLSGKWLSRIFGALVMAASVRMFFR